MSRWGALPSTLPQLLPCQTASVKGLLAAQAKNPKDQYLLLKALNEAIVSLIAEDSMKQLDANHQSQVAACVMCLSLPCTAAHACQPHAHHMRRPAQGLDCARCCGC